MNAVVQVLFVLLGLVAVGSALLVVTSSNLVHAALWLVSRWGRWRVSSCCWRPSSWPGSRC